MSRSIELLTKVAKLEGTIEYLARTVRQCEDGMYDEHLFFEFVKMAVEKEQERLKEEAVC
jgi:hypothetical protein